MVYTVDTIGIHRLIHRGKLGCRLVIDVLSLSSKYILFFLICENGPVPFKYFSFASWHDIKLSHCRRRGFCFLVLVCWLGRLPQLLSAAAQFFQFSAPSVHSSQRSPLLSTWGSSVVDASREASPSEQLS